MRTVWHWTRFRVLTSLALILYFSLLLARDATLPPHVDEAYYAAPAWSLLHDGSFGSPMLEPSGFPMAESTGNMQGIREHTYWIIPFYAILDASVFQLFGFGAPQCRLVSSISCIVVLILLFHLVRRLGGSVASGFLACLICAVDHVFILGGSIGRMDAMGAAFSLGALLWYLRWRKVSLLKALIGSAACCCGSGLSQPNGGFLSTLAIVALALTMDRRQLRLRHVYAFAIPFLLSACAVGIYASRDIPGFLNQLHGNGEYRFKSATSLWDFLTREARRYHEAYASSAEGSRRGLLKAPALLLYIVSFLYCAASKELRKQCQPMLMVSVIYVLYLALFDATKWNWYLIHAVPLISVLASVALAALWRIPRFGPPCTAALVLCLVSLQVAASLAIIRRDYYRTQFLPVVAYLKNNVSPNSLIMGSSELVFGYGFQPNFIDDIRLGKVSGKRADVVVTEVRYAGSFLTFQQMRPDLYRYITSYLTQTCQVVMRNRIYTVYVKRPAPAAIR